MGRKKITIDELYDEINTILEEAEGKVTDCMHEFSTAYAKIGKRKLSAEAPKRTGKYAAGFAYKVIDYDRGSKIILYQKAKPTLTHLLEFGHLNRDGSRTPGYFEFTKIRDELEKEYKDRLSEELAKMG